MISYNVLGHRVTIWCRLTLDINMPMLHPRSPKKTSFYKCCNCNVCNSLICGKHFSHPLRGNPLSNTRLFQLQLRLCVYILKCPCTLTYRGGSPIGQIRRSSKASRLQVPRGHLICLICVESFADPHHACSPCWKTSGAGPRRRPPSPPGLSRH